MMNPEKPSVLVHEAFPVPSILKTNNVIVVPEPTTNKRAVNTAEDGLKSVRDILYYSFIVS